MALDRRVILSDCPCATCPVPGGCFVPRVQRPSDCLCSVPRVLVMILLYGTGTTLVMVLLCGTGTACSTVCVSWYWYACVPICKLETLSGMSQLCELSVELVSTLSSPFASM